MAPNDRKVRIEVGYGLEGIMTDALSSLIIQNDILPQFRDGNMAGGIMAGVDRISAQLTLPEDEARLLAQEAGQRASEGDGGDFGLIIFWGLVLIFFVIIPMFSKKGGKRYRGGAGPVVIWGGRSEEHTSELQSRSEIVCRLLLEKKKKRKKKKKKRKEKNRK